MLSLLIQRKLKGSINREFSGGSVVKNPPANAGDMGYDQPGGWSGQLEPVIHSY